MTVQDTDSILVQNLVGHTVGFKDEDTHRRIVFQPYEKKHLTADLLRRLNYSYGGGVLLREILSVKNTELAREFGVPADQLEYNWTKEDVDKVLTTGTLDELLDALDFGPDGIKELIVDRAVELKLNDMRKREAILEKTGQDITQKINLKDQLEEALAADSTTEEAKPTQRRHTTKAAGSATSTRRVQKKNEA